MPQAALARGEGCLQAVFLGVLTCFQGILSIGNILVFTIIFDVYMIHMELKFLTICHFHIHFDLTAISEVDEMYEN